MAKAQRKSKSKNRQSKRQASLPNGLQRLVKDPRTPRVLGLALLLFAAFLLLALGSHLLVWKHDQSAFHSLRNPWSELFQSELHVRNLLGRLGAIVSHQFIYSWFGLPSFAIIVWLAAVGTNLLAGKKLFKAARLFGNLIWAVPLTAFLLGFFLYSSDFPWGGALGRSLTAWFTSFLGAVGTGLLLIVTTAGILLFVFDLDAKLRGLLKRQALPEDDEDALPKDIRERELLEYGKDQAVPVEVELEASSEPIPEPADPTNEIEIEVTGDDPLEASESVEKTVATEGPELDIETPEGEKPVAKKGAVSDAYDPKRELSNYKMPILDLLEDYGHQHIAVDKAEIEKNKDQIVQTLQNYNIQISRIKATVGPTVTLYEIVPAAGVRISKIKNLEDDIALSLAALGIRIIAPIPGKGTIGIEVPNIHKEIVPMRALIGSDKFVHSDMDLPIALGKTISNDNYIADLAKMPHLLMAGATGQGKSVGINVILVSLLYKLHPSQLKLVMVDPKKVELSLYNRIEKHFLATLPGSEEPIITDTRQVVNTLQALCIEMDERYDLLKNAGVRNIKEYNKKFGARRLNPEKGHRYLPYIVLVVDEFADLIMTAGKEVEAPITRLAQLARAIGIHLIIATQRPSVNIITGTIKANFPARSAFKVTSKVDSRTILDQGGADQLIGRGDMLLSIGGNVTRLQCAFVDTHEVEKIAEFIGDQQGYPEPFYLPEYVGDESSGGSLAPGDVDELFEEAAKLVVMHQQGSTSLIQRRMKLGYNRAGRIMDQLEMAGIVGPSAGSKAREVLYTDEMELEQYLTTLR